MDSLVSIIIPVYNADKYLYKCLDSIINQSYKNIEVIIVDDGSMDNTRSIVNTIRTKDERFKYLYQENGGPSRARNSGLECASGKYVIFIDADDYIDTLMIEKMIQNIGETELVVSDYYLNINNIIEYQSLEISPDELSVATLRELLISTDSFNSLWNKLFIRQIIKDNDIKFNEKLTVGEDQIFLMEYITYCQNISYIREALYYYRIVESSTCRKVYKNHIKMLNHQQKIRKNIMQKWNIKDSEHEIKSAYWFLQNVVSYIYLSSITLRGKQRRVEILNLLNSSCTMEALEIVKDEKMYNRINKTNLYKFLIPIIRIRNVFLIILFSKFFQILYCIKKYVLCLKFAINKE